MEKCIIDILSKSHPDLITSATSTLVASECETICKRGSGTTIQDRSYTGIFEFKWDKFHEELRLKAPNTLKVVSSTISSIPLNPGEKKFTQLLANIANVFHSRNQEMSLLQYQIGLVLTHGSCKQKVILKALTTTSAYNLWKPH